MLARYRSQRAINLVGATVPEIRSRRTRSRVSALERIEITMMWYCSDNCSYNYG